MEERIEKLEARVEELEEKLGSEIVGTSQTELEGFLDTVSPETHVERATAIGFYYVHEADRAPFTVADIKEGYEECRIPKPANLSDVLAGAEEKGWLMRYGKEGQTQLWSVTKEGDSAVDRGFQE